MFISRLGFACLVLSTGCDSTGPKTTALLFDGTITDAATGAAVAGARISLRDFGGSYALVGVELQSTGSGADGRYSISHNRCAASAWLVVSAPGYRGNSDDVDCKAERQNVDIALTRGDPLSSK